MSPAAVPTPDASSFLPLLLLARAEPPATKLLGFSAVCPAAVPLPDARFLLLTPFPPWTSCYGCINSLTTVWSRPQPNEFLGFSARCIPLLFHRLTLLPSYFFGAGTEPPATRNLAWIKISNELTPDLSHIQDYVIF